MKKIFKILIFSIFAIMLVQCFSILFQNNFETSAAFRAKDVGMEIDLKDTKAAILMDFNSKQILFEKNKDQKLPIASMTKLMTIRLVLDEIDVGRLQLDQKISVSENAASATGSQAFLDENKRYSVEELLKTVIMSSANDSSIVLAEFVGGTEKTFVSKMNEKAKAMGLLNTHFENPTGLPSTSHFSSAKDVAVMLASVVEHPIYQKFSKIWMDSIVHPDGRKTELVNTNRMIRTFTSCDGGKTGHTSEAGYCHSVSAKKGSMRLIAVIVGASDSKIRFSQATELLNLGFANFESKIVVDSSIAVKSVRLDQISEEKIDVFAKENFSILMAKGENLQFDLNVKIDKKIKFPVKAGGKVGKLEVKKNNQIVFETDLVVHQKCEKTQLGDVLKGIVREW